MTLAECDALVASGDPDRHASLRAAPEAARVRLLPLYALNLELARAPWASAEPMVAEMRLQWWRDALEEVCAGAPPRGHPVLGAAAPVITGAGLPLAQWEAMAEARRWDIWREPFADAQALAAHLDATAGGLMWAAARTLGADAAAEPVVRDFAQGAGLAAWLVAVPELHARGRQPLPDARPEAIAALAGQGRAAIARARAARAAIPAAALPALWSGWQADALLTKAQSDPAAVPEGRLVLSEFARRGRLLWRVLAQGF